VRADTPFPCAAVTTQQLCACCPHHAPHLTASAPLLPFRDTALCGRGHAAASWCYAAQPNCGCDTRATGAGAQSLASAHADHRRTRWQWIVNVSRGLLSCPHLAFVWGVDCWTWAPVVSCESVGLPRVGNDESIILKVALVMLLIIDYNSPSHLLRGVCGRYRQCLL